MFLNKNTILLLLGQGISGAVVSLLTFSSSLAGKWILEVEMRNNLSHCYADFATIPVSATLCGAFVMIALSSKLMQKYGRKQIFLLACSIGAIGAILAIIALLDKCFWLFCLATFLLGFFSALNQFYRFLATQALKSATQYHINATTALIVGGGIIGAILGPNLANIGANAFNVPFVLSFGFAFLLCVINAIITLPLTLSPLQINNKHIKMSFFVLLKEPKATIAMLSCAFGFAFMTFFMNAAPLSMNEYFHLDSIKNVLVWHFIAMYSPSFFLAFFVRNISPFGLILLGIGFYMLAILVSILLGTSFLAFWLCLVLVGVGWAFSFNGGTFLLNSIKSPHILQLQSINAMAVFGANLCASVGVGFVLQRGGWVWLNYLSFGFIVLFLVAFLILQGLSKHK